MKGNFWVNILFAICIFMNMIFCIYRDIEHQKQIWQLQADNETHGQMIRELQGETTRVDGKINLAIDDFWKEEELKPRQINALIKRYNQGQHPLGNNRPLGG